MAGGLRALAQAARGVAAQTSDPAVQAIVLDTASDVLDKANSLLEEAKKAAGRPGDPESQQRLAQVSQEQGGPHCPLRRPLSMGSSRSSHPIWILLLSPHSCWTSNQGRGAGGAKCWEDLSHT